MKKLLPFLALASIIACNTITIPGKFNKDFEQVKGWAYYDSADRMSPDTMHLAALLTDNKLDFKFPYYSSYKAKIELFYRDSSDYCILKMACAGFKFVNNVQKIKLRFDNAEPVYDDAHIRDNDSKEMWLDASDTLVYLIKKAKRLLIEATFYDDQKQIMEFDILGLKWNHITAKPRTEPKRKQTASNPSAVQNNKHDYFASFFNDNKPMSHSTYQASSNGQVYMVDLDYNNETELQTYQVLDDSKNSVTLFCKYKNKTNNGRTATVKVDFLDSKGNILTTRKVTINCPPNSSVNENIEADDIGKTYRNYKVSIE